MSIPQMRCDLEWICTAPSLALKILLAVLVCWQLVACGRSLQGREDSGPFTEALPSEALPDQGAEKAVPALEARWIVEAPVAKQLIEQGATLLDARGGIGLGRPRLEGAIPVKWDQFSQVAPARRGKLLDDHDALTEKLQALGISEGRPVVIFGNPPGWGEEGRLVWMLRTLGHRQAVFVDGGFQALVAAGVPVGQRRRSPPPAGDFVVQPDLSWDIQRDALKQQLGQGTITVVDTREPREFAGQTPYGEQRGGHIPGAVHLYFKALLKDDGTLLDRPALLAKLAERGITRDRPTVLYCTGGVRSGWLTAVLVTLGFPAKNYAGSMWEWSAAPAQRYPLVQLR